MNDGVENRLTQYADRWRAAQPAAPEIDIPLLLRRTEVGRRVRWIVPLAAAAAVAALVVGGMQIASRNRGAPPPAAATPSPASVGPWAPLPPTHPSIPTVTIPPSPNPAEAAGLPPCQADELRTTTEHDGAGGTNYLFVTFKGSAAPCSLSGRPDVEPRGKGRGLSIPVEEGKVTGDSYEHPVRVDKDHAAVLGLSWTSLWCTEPVVNDHIRLSLPHSGGTLEVDGFGGSPSCNGEPGSGPTPIVVAPFQPQAFRSQEVTTPYANVDIQLDGPASVAASSRFSFEVVLTAHRGDVPLDPCPDYTISQSVYPDYSTETVFALNCAAVPYRDADGRPVLPHGVPVHFAMETTALAVVSDGGVKFNWAIDAPDAMPAGSPMSISPP
jgi:Domain of unknown function (DUF4232)